MKNAAKRKTLRGDIFLFSLIRNRVVYRQNHYRECRDKSHYKSRYKSVLLFAKSADRAHGLSSVRRARFCQTLKVSRVKRGKRAEHYQYEHRRKYKASGRGLSRERQARQQDAYRNAYRHSDNRGHGQQKSAVFDFCHFMLPPFSARKFLQVVGVLRGLSSVFGVARPASENVRAVFALGRLSERFYYLFGLVFRRKAFSA